MISSYVSVLFLVVITIFASYRLLEKSRGADGDYGKEAGALAVSSGRLTLAYACTGLCQSLGPRRGGIGTTFSHIFLAWANSEMTLFVNRLTHLTAPLPFVIMPKAPPVSEEANVPPLPSEPPASEEVSLHTFLAWTNSKIVNRLTHLTAPLLDEILPFRLTSKPPRAFGEESVPPLPSSEPLASEEIVDDDLDEF